jgi:glyoxylase-like metal-dependent hydrolase (beta-lactamase superfamily II)
MTYDGKVRVGGRPHVREMRDLVLTKVAVGPMSNNAYLLRCIATGEQLLIDAANAPDTLVRLVGSDGLATVVTTHRHRDHWVGLAEVVRATGARTAAGEHDADGIDVPTDVLLRDGDRVAVGSCDLEVIHLRGHTPGSVALLYDDPVGHPHLFTGDSLFPGGVGNTHGSTTDFEQLLGDVERKLFDRLPDETWIYPGHGDDTTLGAERPSLPEWRARGW